MIAEFLASPAGLAVKGALIAAFLDLGTGLWRAYQDKTLALDQVAAFLRKHVLGRVFPLTLLVIASYASGDLAATTAAAAGLTLYAAETMASVYAALRIPGSSKVPTD